LAKTATVKDHYIVAIGASAGGLEAIHDFFDHMTDSSHLSFVIIQHLSSDYKSLLVELVSRHTHMQVSEAENETTIRKNCIYVIPNNKFISIRRNKLVLEDKNTSPGPNNAVDTFLYSLAMEKKDKAIAVILSGTGTDGTRGIDDIRENGGMVIVQDPQTAQFDGMPNSAINSGNADFVLPPGAMPDEINHYIRQPFYLPFRKFDEARLQEIFDLIHREAGHDFYYYKSPTLIRRLTRRLSLHHINQVDDYITLLKKDPEECRLLGKDFLIGVTRFFRDQAAFDYLRDHVLPGLLQEKENNDTLKIWICACSTGEEAYSIAILVDELLEQQPNRPEVKIFATDLEQASIDIASHGLYPLSVEKDIPPALLEKYFTCQEKHYCIIPRIRKQIVFAVHDVVKNPPFINNDLVSCRNMLIYMNPVLQQKVISVLLFSLRKNGCLFLGPSETSTVDKDSLAELHAKWKIYKKIKDTRLGSQYLAGMTEHRQPESGKVSWTEAGKKPRQLWDAFKEVLTDELNIAAFYIDPQFEIRETIGNYEKILALPKKLLRLNLLRMVPADLYFVLSSGIKKAWQEDKKTTLNNLRYKKDGQLVSWQVVIQPMQPYTLIVITETMAAETGTGGHLPLPPEQHNAYTLQLEAELMETRSALQQAFGDQEAINEELQSTNEELLSGNEELQSSNEELQSLNEELHTLNTEHQLKIKELVELNNDLNNYFRSTDIAQVFLDRNLSIRKFNTASVRVINLIEADIGRPIAHISNNIRHENFLDDIEQVLQKDDMVEKEVELNNGLHVLMRIMPYLTRDNQKTGVIISFIDITALTHLNNIIRSVLNSNPSAILAFGSVRDGQGDIIDFTLQMANHAAAVFLDKSAAESVGLSLKKNIPLLAHGGLFEQYAAVVQSGQSLQTDVHFDSGSSWYGMGVVRMQDGFVSTFTDITEKKLTEEKIKNNYTELVSVKDTLKKANEQLENKVQERTRALAASEERFRLVARATNDALWDWDFINNTVWWGEAFYKMFGYEKPAQRTERSFWLEKIHPDDREAVNESLDEVINSRKNQWTREYRFLKQSGQYAHILDRGYVLHDESGTPYRMLGSMFDITTMKNAEQRVASNIAQRKFLAESMPLIVWTVDPRGQVDFANKQFETYTGRHYREALGNNWQAFIHREDLSTLRERWASALEDKKDFALEVRVCNAAGEYQWNLFRAKVRKDKDGRLLNLVITITDIHHQKVMNEVLENRVAERTKELENINNALEISNNDLQQFASVASHDLQEPLRKIQLFSGIIRDRFINELSETPRQYLEKIMMSSARMKVLITDILSFSRLSASDSSFEPTNLKQIIDETLDDFEIVIKEKSAAIVIDDLPVIDAIPGQMRQIFQNLLSNALKFSQPGTRPRIVIRGCRIAHKSFDAPEQAEGAWCRITVQDNGIGFDEQFSVTIFNLFQRLHSKDKYEGSGIGLAITKKIIDKHSGLITARSEEGRGATFIIVLPARHLS